jgi:hypothetical protein
MVAGSLSLTAAPGVGNLTDGSSATTNANMQLIATSGGGGGGADSVTARAGGVGIGMSLNGTTFVADSAGGIESGTINGANGNTPTYPNSGVLMCGTGGGGGGGQSVGLVAGNGGNGGTPAGGGGGGGGSLTGTNSGAGEMALVVKCGY